MVTVGDAMLATAMTRLLRQLDVSEPWRADGLCTGYPGLSFFPERGASTKEQKAVCGKCLVRVECLDYSLRHCLKVGIWGGLSERERRRLRKDDQAAAPRS